VERKRQYRTRNWPEYNAALVQRGALTEWIQEGIEENWTNQLLSGKRGASNTYADAAITAALTLKVVYRLPLRATQGLLTSMLQLMGLGHLPVPDYSTLCRRQKTLVVALPRSGAGGPIHLVVDSTGCKVYGEGEWKVRQHGVTKRRTWRKFHVGVDEKTGEIVAAVLTTNDIADSAVLPDLLDSVEGVIEQVSGDGGYDKRPCYEALRKRQREQLEPLQVAIPPRKDARIWQHGNSREERLARDENLRRVRRVGRKQWKEESGYHRRSLAETAMSRFKGIFGDKLKARVLESQATEAFLRCVALNRMTKLGMPQSYAI
jgi:IS5 family transposase